MANVNGVFALFVLKAIILISQITGNINKITLYRMSGKKKTERCK